MSGDVQHSRKTFAFSVESILSKDGDSGGGGGGGGGGGEGMGAKRTRRVDGMSSGSKRAKIEELGESTEIG